MEDFLLGLLGCILELLGETLTDIAFAALVDTALRALRRLGFSARRGSPIAAAIILIAAGVALGFLSAIVVPHPLVHPSKYHGMSLLIGPVITGLVMAAVGRGVRRRGRDPVRIEGFGYGLTFAFAFALIRILIVH